jgi:hypothetical protein
MPCLHGKEIVETDGATLSAALNQASRNLSSLCFVISEIKDLVPLMPEVVFYFSNGGSNCVAPTLAHLGHCNGMLGTWEGSVPQHVFPLLQSAFVNLTFVHE